MLGNPARRITEHRAKIVPGFTSRHGVIMLVHVEEYSSILEARAREHAPPVRCRGGRLMTRLIRRLSKSMNS